MKRINNLVVGLMLTLIITACTGRINSLQMNPNECIVYAKVKIMNYKADVTQYSKLFFDGTIVGNYLVEPDDSSYIYLKMLIGNHYLGRIEFGDRSIGLTDTLLRFETPENKIYYLGDITLQLDLDYNYGSLFGTVGDIVYESRSVDLPPISVENKIENAQKYFNLLFPYNKTLTQCKYSCDTTNVFKESNQVPKTEGPNKKELRRMHK